MLSANLNAWFAQSRHRPTRTTLRLAELAEETNSKILSHCAGLITQKSTTSELNPSSKNMDSITPTIDWTIENAPIKNEMNVICPQAEGENS